MGEFSESVSEHIELVNLGAGTVVVAVIIVPPVAAERAAAFADERIGQNGAARRVEYRDVDPLVLLLDHDPTRRTRGDAINIALACPGSAEGRKRVGTDLL